MIIFVLLCGHQAKDLAPIESSVSVADRRVQSSISSSGGPPARRKSSLNAHCTSPGSAGGRGSHRSVAIVNRRSDAFANHPPTAAADHQHHHRFGSSVRYSGTTTINYIGDDGVKGERNAIGQSSPTSGRQSTMALTSSDEGRHLVIISDSTVAPSTAVVVEEASSPSFRKQNDAICPLSPVERSVGIAAAAAAGDGVSLPSVNAERHAVDDDGVTHTEQLARLRKKSRCKSCAMSSPISDNGGGKSHVAAANSAVNSSASVTTPTQRSSDDVARRSKAENETPTARRDDAVVVRPSPPGPFPVSPTASGDDGLMIGTGNGDGENATTRSCVRCGNVAADNRQPVYRQHIVWCDVISPPDALKPFNGRDRIVCVKPKSGDADLNRVVAWLAAPVRQHQHQPPSPYTRLRDLRRHSVIGVLVNVSAHKILEYIVLLNPSFWWFHKNPTSWIAVTGMWQAVRQKMPIFCAVAEVTINHVEFTNDWNVPKQLTFDSAYLVRSELRSAIMS